MLRRSQNGLTKPQALTSLPLLRHPAELVVHQPAVGTRAAGVPVGWLPQLGGLFQAPLVARFHSARGPVAWPSLEGNLCLEWLCACHLSWTQDHKLSHGVYFPHDEAKNPKKKGQC